MTNAVFEGDCDVFQGAIDKLHGLSHRDYRTGTTKRLTKFLLSDGCDSEDEFPLGSVERQVRELLKEQIQLGVLHVNQPHNDSLSCVGVTNYIGRLPWKIGFEKHVRPLELDCLRQKLFCTKLLGCDARAKKNMRRPN